ncbi:unnamed protein product [Effrenium voratum]|uniref:Vacuolar ATP synthase subunit E n=1 Tax=Effrenium voratum TaxID=2562239 RepID=A0AA36I1I2_9DINO|nr:unnamed protein product [Effrenium voratum]CAJ1379026.1 unnamed protein product [Effrenium voratum]CAJ1418199.1 unnamed protein product [Effrenium voratum]
MDASSKDTQAQILQMTQFILNEARDKAEEIDTKALQEESIERLKIVNSMKEKIQQDYSRKLKQVDTQAAIARSTAINRSRLEKIKSRQEMLGHLSDDSEKELVKRLTDKGAQKKFITKLIVQGLLMLLEDKVEVRCRKCDEALVSECLGDAAKEYAQVIKDNTGAVKSCSLSLDKKTSLPPAPTGDQHGPSCLGGVVLACQEGSITIDNTIDSRLGLVMEQAKPTIRKYLFH